MRQAHRRGLAGAVLVLGLLAGCRAGGEHAPAAGPTPAEASPVATQPGATVGPTAPTPAPVVTISPVTTPTTVTTPAAGATGVTGPATAGPTTGQATSADLLPPPADGRFHSSIAPVPLAVLDRSTWSFGCPVMPEELRYVTVSFKGFDGLAHTGEMLVNRQAARGVVTVFRKLFAAGWPIQGMRIVTAADLSTPSSGDGNNTSAFTCRAVTGSKTAWSEHAYGLAIDLNPFQNPYLSGRTIIPAQAGAYRARSTVRPGMNTSQSLPVRAFKAIGWRWGGDYTSKKDYMHFSANGG